jgi:outer membrane lipoprotein-sorting protein
MKQLALLFCAALGLVTITPVPAQVTVNPDAIGAPPPDAPKSDAPKPDKPKPPAKPPAPKPAAAKPPAQKPKQPVAAKPAPKPAAAPVVRAVAPAPAPVLAAPPVAKASGPERDRLDLQRVSAYLNSVRTLKGQFIQSGPNGELDQGMIYVNKPGRMRFEYAKPSPYLIVADGVSVAVGNSSVKTVDRYPLIDNPLSLILDDKIDLGATSSISRIERKPGQLIITAKREEGSLKGQVTLVFSDPDLQLRQWVVTDAQGLQTLITLQNVQTGVTLEPELFILRDVNKFADPRE